MRARWLPALLAAVCLQERALQADCVVRTEVRIYVSGYTLTSDGTAWVEDTNLVFPCSELSTGRHLISNSNYAIVAQHDYSDPDAETYSYTWNSSIVGSGAAGMCYRGQLEASNGDSSQGAGTATICLEEQNPPPLIEPTCCQGDPHNVRREPLILDLNGDGIHTTSLEASPVLFDLTGNGIADQTAWTSPSTEEGLLYLDLNHNQTIDGGAELFGDATRLPSGERARSGYEALAVYDDPTRGGNGDGVISAGDAVWGRLRLWVDRNHDGKATPSEQMALAQAGVVDISLRFTTLTAEERYGRDEHGNWHLLQGTFTQRFVRDGAAVLVTRAVHDVFFRLIER